MEEFKHTNIKKYQIDAVKTAIKYIESDSNKNCLIHLPTGSGKTGVMALIAKQINNKILIIVPNALLPRQVKDEVEESFWKKIDYKYEGKLKVVILSNINDFEKSLRTNNTVFVTTIHFLQQNSHHIKIDLANVINENISCIFFDEGHREPASRWREFINELTCKLILFTATPYRNDDSIFQIDSKHYYSKDMNYFINNNYISDVEFKSINTKINDFFSMQAHAVITDVELIKIIDNSLKFNKKVLIRCKNPDEIQRLTSLLNKKDIKTLGFHSKLKKSMNIATDGKNISSFDNYDVFIHCQMLIEGFNIPKIKTLIFLDTFNNFRSNIQQIGRALRNTEDATPAQVYLPKNVVNVFKLQWEYLKKYDYSSEEYLYLDNCFKKKNNNAEMDIEGFLIPKKANIFLCSKDIFLNVSKNISDILTNSKKYDIKFEKKGNNFTFFYYEETSYCKFHRRFTSKNINTHVCVFYKIKVDLEDKYYYCYYNSNNTKFFSDAEHDLLSQFSIDNFSTLLDKEASIIQAKYESSTAVYSRGIRGREVVGKDIGNTTSTLEQKMSFIRSAKSKSDDTLRYINTITNRISDESYSTVTGYLRWCDEIIDILTNENEENILFSRFSKLVEPVNDRPDYILIDFEEDVFDEFHREGHLISSKMSDSGFVVTYNDEDYEYGLKYENKRRKYKVCFNNKHSHKNDIALSLESKINNSLFKLYFNGHQVIYINGKFYKPNIQTKFDSKNDWDLYKNIEVIKELENCKNEKIGDGITSNTWPITSVFGVVCKYIEEKYKDIEYLICDDMGTEIADFIALDTSNNKIIYIHCKHSDKKLSASTFQDVCGQAMKNIRYIINTVQVDNQFLLRRKDKWKGKWTNKHVEIERVQTFSKNKGDKNGLAEKAYDRFLDLVVTPGVKYEVWIVHSGLSDNKLSKALVDGKDNEQIPQLIWLIQSTNDYLASAGAELKIFCKE